MDHADGPCPHRSVPVEVDERMVPSGLPWPSCQQCLRESMSSGGPVEHELGGAAEVQFEGLDRPSDPGHLIRDPWSGQPSSDWPCHYGQPAPLRGGSVVHHHGVVFGPSNPPASREESLDHALPLLSVRPPHPVLSQYPAAYHPCLKPRPVQGVCQCRIPPPQPQQQLPYGPDNFRSPPHNARPCLQSRILHDSNVPFQNAPFRVNTSAPDYVPREVMHEVSADLSVLPHPGPITRETKKTISLPEESRIVFITYSVDTAKHMRPFITFLTNQGFKPSIDLFDNPIRRMAISRWMDRYLNDKSVLIIVVISPRYKEDVEGDNDDEHGLHTKYIHNQIQNEFIQQGCRNFRLVPVLFPNATKRHVPNWLLNTRIYSWPRDAQDLLLRLLREERYIIPQTGGDLTLTVRPL